MDCVTRLSVKRFDTPTETELRFSTLETPEGKLLECRSAVGLGPSAAATEGRVVGEQMELTMTTTGKSTTDRIAWSAEYGGFYAVPLSLLRSPLKPGEKRPLKALDAADNQVATIEMSAGEYERVSILGHPRELLRIDSTSSRGEQSLRETLWADAHGAIWKTRSEVLGIETIRATREAALGDTQAVELDLATKLSIPLAKPIADAPRTRRVRYRVQLEGDDPAKYFPQGSSQEVRSIGPHTAEITVYAVRPKSELRGRGAADLPGDGDRQPNHWIQSDDPRIVAAAKQASLASTTSWEIAVALEGAVRRIIHDSGYSQAFDTAADVIASGRGDCTEHAVLLAAMARAQNLPARVAIGLVAKPDALVYHMWTEVYLQERWIGLDATLAQGGIGAGHLKLAHSDLRAHPPWQACCRWRSVAGRLKIEVLEVE